jgi:hypothetical protein
MGILQKKRFNLGAVILNQSRFKAEAQELSEIILK